MEVSILVCCSCSSNTTTFRLTQQKVYEELVKRLSKETGLPISIDYHYKFLVLLPLEADEKTEVLKHYFGITYEDELVVRGIETRRHDTLNFIKQFQTESHYSIKNLAR
jgi:DNA polymerase elongation subunit (family B)